MATLNKAEARADFIRYELLENTPVENIPELWSQYTQRLAKAGELPLSALAWPAPVLRAADRPGRKAAPPARSKAQDKEAETAPKRKRKRTRANAGTAIVVAGPPAAAIPVVSYRRQGRQLTAG